MDHECGTHKFMTIVEGVKCHPSGGEKGHRVCLASQVVQVVKKLPVNAGDIRDAGSIPGSGRCPGEGNENPLRYSCLENSMDRGTWQLSSTGLRKVGHDCSNSAHTEHIPLEYGHKKLRQILAD